MDRLFQLKVNGKELSKVTAKPGTAKTEFIKFVKNLQPEFNDAKDILEITDITPPGSEKMVRHKARDKSPHNKLIADIVTRHVNNLISTYGQDRVALILKELTKAS